jgi:predicted transcriptional regulator of viral defense system
MKNKFIEWIIIEISKKKWKILTIEEMKALIQKHLLDEFSEAKCYKLLYYLKKKWHLLSLKKDIYYITDPQQERSEYEIIHGVYWDIVHAHCNATCWNKTKRYIGWMKAFELHLLEYAIPDTILIVTKEKQALETVLQWKTILFKTYTNKKNTLFSTFAKHTSMIKLGKYVLPVANLELAMLETLYNIDPLTERLFTAKAQKYIKKIKQLDFTVIKDALQIWKHHTSCNRLYKILKTVRPQLAAELLQYIKQRWFVIDT